MSGVKSIWVILAVTFAVTLPAVRLQAADHGDAPSVAHDQAADIADAFLFLDPNDNSRVIVAASFHGFIVPGEAVNFAIFDPVLRYRFEIENTGNAKPDLFIDVRFTQRVSTSEAQIATVTLPNGKKFDAPATNPSLGGTAPVPVITTDARTGITFFAGEVDDPFFFDIPAFARFVASVRAGTPDVTQFDRGRDSFAGYNVLAIVLSIPANQLKGKAGNVIGMDFLTQRRDQRQTKFGEVFEIGGEFRNVDRAGNPAVNVALIPFPRKNEQNASTTVDDARGKFVDDILATLTLFGTDDISKGIFFDVAIRRGDYLRLDTSIANSGPRGGTNDGAGFPNGRRLADDTIDTELFLINNRSPLGDNVDASDVPPRDEFPFFAASQQPRAAGTIDDNTRN